MKNCKIHILLATYNGEKFLNELIHSIYEMDIPQDYQLNILVRDDNSTDGTAILLNKQMQERSNFNVLEDSLGQLGAAGNFSCLLEAAFDGGAKYVMFADQDDVWSPNKLLLQIEKMHKLEKSFPNMPLLVHSDMNVVDSFLKVIAPSFMNYQGIKHEGHALPVLLAQNFMTGCTMLANRELLNVALPIPKEALMHDWWLALCAAAFGWVGYIDEPLLKYRQHENNEVGAKHVGNFMNPLSGKWVKRWQEGKNNLFRSMKQAEALAERIRKHYPENPCLEMVEAYAALYRLSALKRIHRLRELGIHAQSNSRQALLLSRLLLAPKVKYD